MCNFRDALTIKHINETHIEYVQNFIRNRLPKILLHWKSLNNSSVIKDEDFFGVAYCFDHTSFEFSPGDRIQITTIAAHVNKITLETPNYFENIESNENSDVEKPSFNSYSNFTAENETQSNVPSRTHFFLNKLMSAANQNVNRKKGGYRYDNSVKKYASYLRMIAGPLAYETIQKNLPCSLPSLSSTNRYIQKSNCRITEGVLRSEELLNFLNERKLEKAVTLSEDATRIVGQVQYNVKTNQITGFVLPINNKNGMPVPFSYPARSADEIMEYFDREHSVSPLVNAIMAQPIGNGPPFCLMIYGSDNKFTSDDVCKRWKFIINELKQLNIYVIAFSSDSDPRYNTAMRKLSQLGKKSKWFGSNWFSFGGKRKKTPTHLHEIDPVYIQDTTHIATKLRNLTLKTIKNEKKLKIGNYFIKQSHLRYLVENYSKDEHNLTNSTLNPIDKQNFCSAKRICSDRVIKLLQNRVPDSQGTAKFLEIMKAVIDAYMDKQLCPLERVYKIWNAVFMLRLWRAFIISKKGLSLKNNFLSLNCYVCIEMNAHSLIKCLIQLREINKPHLFTPHLFESQACEALFRQVRSFTSTYSTVANCTVKQILERISKIQLQNDITARVGDTYIFPRLGTTKANANFVNIPSIEEIKTEIERAKTDAVRDAIALGLIKKGDAAHFDYSCKIPVADKPASKKSKQNVQHVRGRANQCRIQLDRVSLKNFSDRFIDEEIDETSAFLEIYRNNDTGKRIVVKKMSFVWLLRNDPVKLSSDRLERVKLNAKTRMMKKKQITIPIHRYIKRRKQQKLHMHTIERKP